MPLQMTGFVHLVCGLMSTPERSISLRGRKDCIRKEWAISLIIKFHYLSFHAELESTVKALLKDADLDAVTMKVVLKDVQAKYPDVDLSSKKDFLKSTVKEIIS